jgi:site-specific DNA-cytosine methylase
MEQVLELLTVNGGQDYATVMDAFKRLGYHVDVVAHNSRAYVPQTRGRLYFVGCRAEGYAARALLPVRGDGATDPHLYSAARWRAAGSAEVGARCYRKSRSPGDSSGPERWVSTDYAPTLIETETGKRAGALVVDDHGVRVLTPVEWERCHGFPDGWTEPAGGDVARWERLGNAVSPPVARRIGEGILAAEGVAA